MLCILISRRLRAEVGKLWLRPRPRGILGIDSFVEASPQPLSPKWAGIAVCDNARRRRRGPWGLLTSWAVLHPRPRDAPRRLRNGRWLVVGWRGRRIFEFLGSRPHPIKRPRVVASPRLAKPPDTFTIALRRGRPWDAFA
jgi:hypothetical protein